MSQTVYYRPDQPEVVETAAGVIASWFDTSPIRGEKERGLEVGIGSGPPDLPTGPWIWMQLADGVGQVSASGGSHLYCAACMIEDGFLDGREEAVRSGLLLEPAFGWHRPVYDMVLTQISRSVRDFDREIYVASLARSGFTHLEVNGLEAHVPLEPGVPNEYYAQFYSYGSGLNHFVESPLTQGYYPIDYQTANLNRLRKNAALGRKYGLKPGMLCFEPRTLPEAFFQRYPTLRGARVDHPFRSHIPRYCLAQDHPVARQHYRDMMRALMTAVPDLAYMSVWTNDSGAGFEHSASLYVGRNGGPYMIREWRSHEKIAEAAGRSAASWLQLIRESAAEINPDFEVLLRIEPFKVEHEHLIAGMGGGVSYEAPSLLVRGYHLPYSHPRYPEQESVGGSLQHVDLDPAEADVLASNREAGIEPRMTYAISAAYNMEPLLGIPWHRMIARKLKAMKDLTLEGVSAFGGLAHIEKTPYWPNAEVIRAFQTGRGDDIDVVLKEAATRWCGAEHADDLVELWDAVDEAVSWIPHIPLFSVFGFVWLRTWVRPFIPNLEAPPKEDRAYYERFMVTTPNNPSINDLGKDVLFELITKESGGRIAGQFDANVFPRLDAIEARLTGLAVSHDAFRDLLDRVRALRCWTMTQRNTCAWVHGVYGFLDAEEETVRSERQRYVDEVIEKELQNARNLLALWEESKTEFMLVSGIGETAFIYGENFGELVRRKIDLTEEYGNVEPFIDHDIIWRI